MSILKKQARCSKCSNMIRVGEEVSWVKSYVATRHPGNGTVTKESVSWIPAHVSFKDCELAKVEGVSSQQEARDKILQGAKSDLSKLSRQKNTYENEPDMLEAVNSQIRDVMLIIIEHTA